MGREFEWTFHSYNGSLREARADLTEFVPSVSDCIGPKTAFGGAFFTSARLLLPTSARTQRPRGRGCA